MDGVPGGAHYIMACVLPALVVNAAAMLRLEEQLVSTRMRARARARACVCAGTNDGSAATHTHTSSSSGQAVGRALVLGSTAFAEA